MGRGRGSGRESSDGATVARIGAYLAAGSLGLQLRIPVVKAFAAWVGAWSTFVNAVCLRADLQQDST
jgi:hypothetical protein